MTENSMQHKKIKIKKKNGRYEIFLDEEKHSATSLLRKYPFLYRTKVVAMAGAGNKQLLEYINDSIFKNSRGVPNRAKVYRLSNGKRFVVSEIARKAGIDKSSAHARVQRWEAGRLHESMLFAPKSQARTGSEKSLLAKLSGEPRPFNTKIPLPTSLERRVFGW